MIRRAFRTLSALRRARIFHPRGTARRAVVTVDDGPHHLDALAGRHDALVRLSRGLGIPSPAPDVLGVAIKLLGVHGRRRDQDLLLATAVRFVPLPRRSLRRGIASSIAPYRNRRRERFLVGGRWRGDGFDLLTARPLRRWRVVGRVELDAGAAVPDRPLRFSPWTTGGGLVPAGWLNRARRPAYAGSQEGRPDT